MSIFQRAPWFLVHPKARTPRFWTWIFCGVVVLFAAAAYSFSNYRIGFSNEGEQSIGSAWTLVRLHAGPAAVGTYGVFVIGPAVRKFAPGTQFVKLIVGKPGDLVRIGDDQTTVNGKKVSGSLDSLGALGLKADDVERTFILGPNEYFAVGTRPHSYDSRYWGPVRGEQFVGTATLL